MNTETADAVALIDSDAVSRYLKAHLPGFRSPLQVTKFPAGQSNPTFLLESPSGRYVLRRKPPGKLLKSAHAVDREYRVMRALRGTEVPVPRPYLLCEDEEVTGAVFFVMSLVEGRSFADPRIPEVGNEERCVIYDEMNRVLVALHSLDVAAIGLADFGRPGNYFERQVGRWTKQYQASATEVIPAMDRLMVWLGDHTPPDDGRVSLVHGDYRIDNMIMAVDAPRIAALLDWELSTLGHPFADLAYQCMQWRMPVGEQGRGLAGVNRERLGIPTEKAYVARYCQRAGLAAIENWAFYLAFSFFRFAAILQGVLKRALDGNASNPDQAKRLGAMVPVLAEKAMVVVKEGA